MHEATIAQFILEKSKQISAGETAKLLEAGGFVIASVSIRVGEFRNVDLDSLTFAFDALKKDDPLTQNTSLEIEFIAVAALCKNSHRYSPCAELFFACPECSQGMETLIQGKELEITCVKIEELDINGALRRRLKSQKVN